MRTFILRNAQIKQGCIDAILRLPMESPFFQVSITYYDPEKSHEQRKLWHKLLTEIGNQLGVTMGQVKHAIKVEFYGLEDYELEGKAYTFVQSSEESKKGEYSRLIEFTYQWASERGLTVT